MIGSFLSRPSVIVARRVAVAGLFAAMTLWLPTDARAQSSGDPTASVTASGERDRAIAERFAPIFHQGMVGSRFDFITNFDFDGDWVGDNNWANAGDAKYRQLAYIYYAVSETPTHYFVHYAAFHPRDYKGGELTGAMLSQAVRRGAKASTKVAPTSIANDVVLAHENDLEGCLVVARKKGPSLDDAEVEIVETLAHNKYLKYQPSATLAKGIGVVRLEGQHPLIYIEPKGHGIEAFADQPNAPAEGPDTAVGTTGRDGRNNAAGANGSDGAPVAGGGLVGRITGLVSRVEAARKLVNNEKPETIRVYRFTGTAEDPEKTEGDIGYDLVPTITTLWERARKVPNETYGERQDYGEREVRAAGAAKAGTTKLGPIGSSFRGVQGAENKARPPWGWFDMTERDRPLGEWFFDPAAAVRRHFPSLEMDAGYLHQPFLGVTRTP